MSLRNTNSKAYTCRESQNFSLGLTLNNLEKVRSVKVKYVDIAIMRFFIPW